MLPVPRAFSPLLFEFAAPISPVPLHSQFVTDLLGVALLLKICYSTSLSLSPLSTSCRTPLLLLQRRYRCHRIRNVGDSGTVFFHPEYLTATVPHSAIFCPRRTGVVTSLSTSIALYFFYSVLFSLLLVYGMFPQGGCPWISKLVIKSYRFPLGKKKKTSRNAHQSQQG